MSLPLLAVLALAANATNQEARPRVVVLTTGGTIASQSAAPALEGPALVQAVPQLLAHAAVTVEEIARTGSSRMTPAIWLHLSRTVNARFAADRNLAGIVITHGTDTMEEAAYFLNLTVRDLRPVVMVGSMRSANTISADGPSNLLQAVRVAVQPHSANRGVMLVMNDVVHAARDVWKTDNQRVETFRSPERGILGYADPDTVLFYRSPGERHTQSSEFDLTGIDTLPAVPIVADYAGYDGATIGAHLRNGVAGMVVQTFAGGRMSAGALRAIQEAVAAGVPVVISSRVPGGRISGDPLVPGSVLARELPAHKARVLLMTALAAGVAAADLQRVFDQY